MKYLRYSIYFGILIIAIAIPMLFHPTLSSYREGKYRESLAEFFDPQNKSRAECELFLEGVGFDLVNYSKSKVDDDFDGVLTAHLMDGDFGSIYGGSLFITVEFDESDNCIAYELRRLHIGL